MNKYIFILVGILFLFPTVSFASIDKSLKYGSQGLDVSELQEFLISKGFLSGQITGNFFSLTKNAVVAYQTSVGLPATGFVGVMTREKINNELTQANSSSTTTETTETQTVAPVNQNNINTQQQIQNILSQIAQLNNQMMQLKQNTQTQVKQIAETTQNIASTSSQTVIEPIRLTVEPSVTITHDASTSTKAIETLGIPNFGITTYHFHFETNLPTTGSVGATDAGGHGIPSTDCYSTTSSTIFDCNSQNLWGQTLIYKLYIKGVDKVYTFKLINGMDQPYLNNFETLPPTTNKCTRFPCPVSA